MSMFTPDEFNTARPNNYQLSFKRLPGVVFHLQNLSIPTVTIQEVEVANPMIEWQLPDTHISYENLSVSFLIDEKFSNWKEIHSWLNELWSPTEAGADKSMRELTSDATLHIMSNSGNPIATLTFHNMYPVSLSSVEMTVMADADPIMCDVDFNYTHYTFSG